MKKQIQEIIYRWIHTVKERNVLDRVGKQKSLWLLLDFSGDDYTRYFYEEHAKQAMDVLDSLDANKSDVTEVKKYLKPIIDKYMDKQEVFF